MSATYNMKETTHVIPILHSMRYTLYERRNTPIDWDTTRLLTISEPPFTNIQYSDRIRSDSTAFAMFILPHSRTRVSC